MTAKKFEAGDLVWWVLSENTKKLCLVLKYPTKIAPEVEARDRALVEEVGGIPGKRYVPEIKWLEYVQ